MNQSKFKQKGIDYVTLSKKEAISVFRKWVEIYFAETKRKTGKYQPTNYKWESYWSGDEPCHSGDEALSSYQKSARESFFIIDEAGRNGIECPPQDWPSFLDAGMDLYVIPKSLAWSMTFTHEGTCHYAKSTTANP